MFGVPSVTKQGTLKMGFVPVVLYANQEFANSYFITILSLVSTCLKFTVKYLC